MNNDTMIDYGFTLKSKFGGSMYNIHLWWCLIIIYAYYYIWGVSMIYVTDIDLFSF